jgi:pSer/pThr/pTyr-binding forkhead associated (FHA) protein
MNQVFARLVMQRGPQPNQTFELIEDKISIGRSPNNIISIPDPEISRKHAQLIWQGDGYVLEDLGSTNGLFVNTRRIIGSIPLYHGDVIELGEAISLLYLVELAEADTIISESELDTGRWQRPAERPEPEPEPEPIYNPPPEPAPRYYYDPVPVPSQEEPEAARRGFSCQQQILLGCGMLILMLFCCMASLYFLDAYDQGRLLYCGPLRSFWQFILGPFGFAPVCP